MRNRLRFSAVTVALAALTTSPVVGQYAAPAPNQALRSTTVGASLQRAVTTSGYDITTENDVSLGGFVFQDGYPLLHTDGGYLYGNLGVGLNALVNSTPALPYPTSGTYNTAIGAGAMRDNTTGYHNSAVGTMALAYNTTGILNTAGGALAMQSNTTGSINVGIGRAALHGNTTGQRNIAVGASAGFFATTGSNNIWIGHYGVADEAHTLRIGRGTGTGYFQQTRAFISGIRGVTTDNDNAVAVLVDNNGQLGTVSSSRQAKEEIRDMGQASESLLELRPVTFRYKRAFADGVKPLQFGLIAEEVAEVLPELVSYDDEGRPESVKYHVLSSLLLNELQEQQRRLTRQTVELRELQARLRELAEVEARLARLEAAQGQTTAALTRP